MDKRIALYYPHSSIHDEATLKRALLLWDNVELIVPYEDFRFRAPSRESIEALEMFGLKRVPTHDEKTQAHTAIDELVSHAHPVLSLRSGESYYEMYSHKFLDETWRLLEQRELQHPGERNLHAAVSPNTGLIIMAVLADVLAGQSRALYTDRTGAYETLWTALGTTGVGSNDLTPSGPLEQLVPIAFCNINLDDIPLTHILNLRKREEGVSGASLRTLRHSLQSFVATRAEELSTMMGKPDAKESDITEFIRQAESDFKDDVALLRSELGALTTQNVFSKDMLTPFAFAASSLWTLVTHPQLTGIPGILTFGSVVSMHSKYRQQRLDIQKKHPTSYALQLRHRWI